jgi:hypothetical protein
VISWRFLDTPKDPAPVWISQKLLTTVAPKPTGSVLPIEAAHVTPGEKMLAASDALSASKGRKDRDFMNGWIEKAHP